MVDWLRRRGIEPYAVSKRFYIVAADVPEALVDEIRKLDYVEVVTPEEFVKPMEDPFLSWLKAVLGL